MPRVSGGLPGACTYSIHSLDVLRLILSYFYLICAMSSVIFGLVKRGKERLKGGSMKCHRIYGPKYRICN